MQLTSFLHEAATAASLCTSARASWTRCSAAASSSWWSCFRDAHAVPLSPEASPLKASSSFTFPDTRAVTVHSGLASTDSHPETPTLWAPQGPYFIKQSFCIRESVLHMSAVYLFAGVCLRMLRRAQI